MKKFGLFKKGSVEVLSNSNAEHGRGHVADRLTPEQILAGRFYIIGINSKGIKITGGGIGTPKLITW